MTENKPTQSEMNVWEAYACASLDEGRERMNRMEKSIEVNTQKIDENTAMTKELKESTAEMLAAFNHMKGGFKVLEWLATGAKWVAALGAAIALIWQMAHGDWPGK